MHHPAVPSLRRLLAAVALACATLAVGAVAARANGTPPHLPAPPITPSTPVTPGSGYLALGDSVTFGYQESTVVPAPNYRDAASFTAYPAMLGDELDLRVANLACPGETSASLINANAPSNGCENSPDGSAAYRTSFPLHVKYSGSQLGDAVKYLSGHPGVRLVSLMIGANDLFLCQEQTTDGCLSSSEQAPVLAGITRNVRKILSTLRTKAHYGGQIVVLDYYSLNYASPLVNGESQILNRAEAAGAKGFHVRFANAYTTFAAASVHSGNDTCTAGLLTQLGAPGTCGVHPSYAGQALLAQTVARAIKVG